MSKNREFLTQLRRDIGSNSVLQKGPGAVQDALGVGKNDLLVLARAKRDLGGENIGVFGVEEALFPQDAQEVQQFLRVVRLDFVVSRAEMSLMLTQNPVST